MNYYRNKILLSQMRLWPEESRYDDAYDRTSGNQAF